MLHDVDLTSSTVGTLETTLRKLLSEDPSLKPFANKSAKYDTCE